MTGIDFNSVLNELIEKTGKSEIELREMAEQRKKKFSGLLNNEGALFMVAKDLGIDLNLDKKLSEQLKISQLEEGMQDVELLVRVLAIYTPRKFEKNKRKGKVCNVLVGDDSGEIMLTLWNKDVDRLETEKIEKGNILLLQKALVNSFKEKLQLSIGYSGKFIPNPENIDEKNLPPKEKNIIELRELKEEMRNIDVFVRILRIYPERSFEANEKPGKVINFEIADASGKTKAVAWNDLSEIVSNLNEGTIIKIENAYTKKGLNGIELHLGWNSRLLKNPNTNIELPSIESISGKEFERKKINELEKGKEAEVIGTIVNLNKGNLYYKCCNKCSRKVEELNGKFVCREHGEVEEPDINLILSIILDDGVGLLNATFFGRQAEDLIGIHKNEFKKLLEEKPIEDIFNDLKKIIGKTIIIQGKTKTESFRENEIDFTVSNWKEPDFKQETEKIIKLLK